MKQYIFILLFIGNCYSCYSQELFCGYEQLHNKYSHVKFESLNLKKKVKVYNISGEGKLDEMCKVELNRKYNIIHIFPSLTSKLSSIETSVDTLGILNRKFCIQATLQDSAVINPEVKKIFEIKYFKNIYLLIEGSYEEENNINYHKHWVLFFDITDKNNVKNITNPVKPDVFGFSDEYYGDFNNDKILDFIFINDNKLQLYSLINGTFVLKDYFIYLNFNGSVLLNLLNSKWFFKIEKICSKSNVEKLINKKSDSYIYIGDKKWQ